MNLIYFIIIFILIYIAILKRPFNLHEGTIALLGTLILLISEIITPVDAFNSIIGSNTNPWQIIIFFITFTIISTTLEDLGFFKWCAIQATEKAGKNGKKLFNYLFIITAIITFLTSNDIVILTLTPFVLHLGLHHGKTPKAYLFTIFFVANTGSLGHLLGNLTNIIVSNTFEITFLSFLKYLFAPMIAALAVEYLILRWYFRKEINQKFNPDKSIKTSQVIENKTKIYIVLAILSSIIFLALLEPIHGINLWILTTTGAILTIVIGRFNPIKRIKRIPWQVVLFITNLFIIITGFTKTGINNYLLEMITFIQDKSLFGITITASFIASIISAVINNIPGTIIMTETLANSSLTSLSQKSVIYSIIIGSNLGANITIIGSLAGLMWIHLIREKDYDITALEFSKIGVITMIPTILIVSLILFLEIILF